MNPSEGLFWRLWGRGLCLEVGGVVLGFCGKRSSECIGINREGDACLSSGVARIECPWEVGVDIEWVGFDLY